MRPRRPPTTSAPRAGSSRRTGALARARSPARTARPTPVTAASSRPSAYGVSTHGFATTTTRASPRSSSSSSETFLEALLEDIIDRILTARGADVKVREIVLDGQRAIGGRIGRLFPHLTGESFEDAAAEMGFRELPRRWRTIRQARNAFIHDSPFNSPRETPRCEHGERGDAPARPGLQALRAHEQPFRGRRRARSRRARAWPRVAAHEGALPPHHWHRPGRGLPAVRLQPRDLA